MELHLELVEVVEEESKENFFDEVKWQLASNTQKTNSSLYWA